MRGGASLRTRVCWANSAGSGLYAASAFLLPSSHCMATTCNMHGDLIAGRMLVRWAAVPHGPCRSDPHRSDHPSSDRRRIRTAMAEGARRRAAHVDICAVSLQPVRRRADARSRRSIRRQWDSRLLHVQLDVPGRAGAVIVDTSQRSRQLREALPVQVVVLLLFAIRSVATDLGF